MSKEMSKSVSKPGDSSTFETGSSHLLGVRLQVVCSLLLVMIFFQSFNIWESYLPQFLVSEKGVTREMINLELIPYWSYAYFIGLIPIAFLAEYVVGYAAVVATAILCRLLTHIIIPHGRTLMHQQMAQCTYGLACSMKIAFSVFVYNLLPEHIFHQFTAYFRSTSMIAHVASGGVGWLMMEVFELEWNWFFIWTQLGLLLALCSFVASLVLSRSSTDRKDEINAVQKAGKSVTPTNMSSPKQILRTIYSSPIIILWSVWWMVAFSVLMLSWSYWAILFQAIASKNGKNGIVWSTARLVSAVAALLSKYAKPALQTYGLYFMIAGSTLVSILLFIAGSTSSLWVAYACFIGVPGTIEFTFIAASASVASSTPKSLRGVALFLNTFLSMALENSVQILCGPWVFALDPRSKFIVFAIMMASLAVLLAVLSYFLQPSKPLDTKAGTQLEKTAQIELSVREGTDKTRNVSM